MKIELCEDNGFMNNGKPTLVVLVVTDESGKQRRIPYEAGKTIQQLYEDVQKMNIKGAPVLETDVPVFDFTPEKEMNIEAKTSDVIEREDIVRCVKAYERESNQDLKVGNEYRVISIEKVNGKVYSYEVLDDKAPAKYRIRVAPEEIILIRKAPPRQPKNKSYKDIIEKCECGTENALVLSGEKYQGTCTKCGKVMVKQLTKSGV